MLIVTCGLPVTGDLAATAWVEKNEYTLSRKVTITFIDRFHCIGRWPAHTVTTRDRFHCIGRWPAHTVTTRDRFHCIWRGGLLIQ